MKIGLGHIAIIMIPLTVLMSLVLYHCSKPQWQLFNALGFPLLMAGFFTYIYLLLRYFAKEDTTPN